VGAVEGIAAEAERRGMQGPPPGARPCLVAGYKDHVLARAAGRPTIYVEHGAGQSYAGDPVSARMSGYPGGMGHEGTLLFVAPGEAPRARWEEFYPDVPAVAVGCPKLDGRHRAEPRARARALDGATVAVSFHWPNPLIQETRSAWPHWAPGLADAVADLSDAGATVLGHAHPRLWRHVAPLWRRWGAEPVEDFGEVLDRADVFAADNTSALPEAAICGVPLVWIDHPFYRRDVEHGGRFWRWPRGQVTCGGPEFLADAAGRALADPEPVRAAREAMVAEVYVACDGRAAERAADAIRGVLQADA
jgi:hypothetical protein